MDYSFIKMGKNTNEEVLNYLEYVVEDWVV